MSAARVYMLAAILCVALVICSRPVFLIQGCGPTVVRRYPPDLSRLVGFPGSRLLERFRPQVPRFRDTRC
jgi:hypothetical protein